MSRFARGEEARRIWSERLGRYEACSQSVKDFCVAEGVSTASLYQWKRRLRKSEAASALVVQPKFQPVHVVNAPSVTIDFDGLGTLRVPATHLEAVRVVVSELVRVAQGRE